MKIERIHFEQLYPTGIYANQRYRIEASVTQDEDLIQCYKELQSKTEAAFVALNPQIKWEEQKIPDVPAVKITNEESKQKVIESHVKTIGECKTMKNLEMFRALVERENIDVLYEAYHNKKKQLENGLASN